MFRGSLATKDTKRASSIKPTLVGYSPINVWNVEMTSGHSVGVLSQAMCTGVRL